MAGEKLSGKLVGKFELVDANTTVAPQQFNTTVLKAGKRSNGTVRKVDVALLDNKDHRYPIVMDNLASAHNRGEVEAFDDFKPGKGDTWTGVLKPVVVIGFAKGNPIGKKA